MRDPNTGKPLALIVDNKNLVLIDMKHSSIVGGGKKKAPKVKKSTVTLKKPAGKGKAGAKKAKAAAVKFSAATKKLIAAKTLTKAQISD